jgi:hypothetical protein
MRLLVGNSNVVELENLQNNVSGLHDAGATVSLTLYEADGDEVTGEIWPLNMAYDPETLTYRVTMSDGININAGQFYTAVVRAVGSGLEVGKWTIRLRAQERFCG